MQNKQKDPGISIVLFAVIMNAALFIIKGFAGIEANKLLSEIEEHVAVSAGAACHSDRVDLSATLQALQVPLTYAMGTIRFSTGKPTTSDEIDRVVQVVTSAIGKLR